MSPTLRSAAILLSSLPSQTASRLLAQMDAQQVRQIRAAINELQDVDPLERRRALEAFRRKQGQQHAAPAETDSFESLFSAAATENAATTATPDDGGEREPQANGPFGFLQELPDDDVAGVLLEEGPQTIAAVLAGLSAHKASRLLERIPFARRSEVVRRLATLDRVPDESAEEIAQSLRQVLLASRKEHTRGDGPRALLRILGELSANERDSVLSAVETVDPLLFASLRRRHTANEASKPGHQVDSLSIATSPAQETPVAVSAATPDLTFDQLQQKPPQELRGLLAELPGDIAILVLCAMQPATVDRLLAELPPRTAKDTRRRMRGCQPVAKAELDHARHLLLKVARRQQRRVSDPILAVA